MINPKQIAFNCPSGSLESNGKYTLEKANGGRGSVTVSGDRELWQGINFHNPSNTLGEYYCFVVNSISTSAYFNFQGMIRGKSPSWTWCWYFRDDNLYCDNANAPSDVRFKTNFEPIRPLLDGIAEIETFMFNWINKPEEPKHFGISAQSLKVNFPELVLEVEEPPNESGDSPGTILRLNDFDMNGFFFRAFQELIEKIEILEARIEALENAQPS